jgi:hypothetical protein
MDRLGHVLTHVRSGSSASPLQRESTSGGQDVQITGCVGRTVYDSRGGPTGARASPNSAAWAA